MALNKKSSLVPVSFGRDTQSGRYKKGDPAELLELLRQQIKTDDAKIIELLEKCCLGKQGQGPNGGEEFAVLITKFNDIIKEQNSFSTAGLLSATKALSSFNFRDIKGVFTVDKTAPQLVKVMNWGESNIGEKAKTWAIPVLGPLYMLATNLNPERWVSGLGTKLAEAAHPDKSIKVSVVNFKDIRLEGVGGVLKGASAPKASRWVRTARATIPGANTGVAVAKSMWAISSGILAVLAVLAPINKFLDPYNQNKRAEAGTPTESERIALLPVAQQQVAYLQNIAAAVESQGIDIELTQISAILSSIAEAATGQLDVQRQHLPTLDPILGRLTPPLQVLVIPSAKTIPTAELAPVPTAELAPPEQPAAAEEIILGLDGVSTTNDALIAALAEVTAALAALGEQVAGGLTVNVTQVAQAIPPEAIPELTAAIGRLSEGLGTAEQHWAEVMRGWMRPEDAVTPTPPAEPAEPRTAEGIAAQIFEETQRQADLAARAAEAAAREAERRSSRLEMTIADLGTAFGRVAETLGSILINAQSIAGMLDTIAEQLRGVIDVRVTNWPQGLGGGGGGTPPPGPVAPEPLASLDLPPKEGEDPDFIGPPRPRRRRRRVPTGDHWPTPVTPRRRGRGITQDDEDSPQSEFPMHGLDVRDWMGKGGGPQGGQKLVGGGAGEAGAAFAVITQTGTQLATTFAGLSPVLTSAAGWLSGLGAAVATATVSVVTLTTTLGPWVVALAAVAAVIGVVLAAFAALGIGSYLLVNAVSTVATGLLKGAEDFGSGLNDVFGKIAHGDLYGALASGATTVTKVFEDLGTTVSGLIPLLGGYLSDVIKAFSSAVQAGIQIMTGFAQNMLPLVQQISPSTVENFNYQIRSLQASLGLAFTGFVATMSDTVQQIAGIFLPLASELQPLFTEFAGMLRSLILPAVRILAALLGVLVTPLRAALDGLRGVIVEVVKNMVLFAAMIARLFGVNDFIDRLVAGLQNQGAAGATPAGPAQISSFEQISKDIATAAATASVGAGGEAAGPSQADLMQGILAELQLIRGEGLDALLDRFEGMFTNMYLDIAREFRVGYKALLDWWRDDFGPIFNAVMSRVFDRIVAWIANRWPIAAAAASWGEWGVEQIQHPAGITWGNWLSGLGQTFGGG